MSGVSSYELERRRRAKEEARRKKLEEERKKHEAMMKEWQKKEEEFLKTGMKTRQISIDEDDEKRQRKKITEILEEKKLTLPDITNETISESTMDQNSIVEKIESILEKIHDYDNVLYQQKNKEFEKIIHASKQKQEFFYDSLKLDYAKIKSDYMWTQTYKQSIQVMYESYKNSISLSEEMEQEFHDFLNFKHISENKYNEMFEKLHNVIEDQKYKEELIGEVVKTLNELDYLIVENVEDIATKLLGREKVIFSTKMDEYKVVFVLNRQNKLLTRFVKIVDKSDEIGNMTSSQKIRDKENVKRWCEVQRQLQKKLHDSEYEVDLNIIEDEESDILYMINRDNLKESYQLNKKGVGNYGKNNY